MLDVRAAGGGDWQPSNACRQIEVHTMLDVKVGMNVGLIAYGLIMIIDAAVQVRARMAGLDLDLPSAPLLRQGGCMLILIATPPSCCPWP